MSENKQVIGLEEIGIGAKWWADKLRGGKRPSRDYVSNPNQVSGLEWVAAQMTAGKPKFTNEQIDKFERELVISMIHNAQIRPEGDFHVHLGCDYGPDQVIEAAVSHSGIGDLSSFLPWKTHMWCKRGQVTVAEGYRANTVYLMGHEKAVEEYNATLQLWLNDVDGFRSSRIAKLHPSEIQEFLSKSLEEQYHEWFGGVPIKG